MQKCIDSVEMSSRLHGTRAGIPVGSFHCRSNESWSSDNKSFRGSSANCAHDRGDDRMRLGEQLASSTNFCRQID